MRKFAVSEEILFLDGDIPQLGVIEAVEDSTFTVRVLAVTGDGVTQPTDRVVRLDESELMPLEEETQTELSEDLTEQELEDMGEDEDESEVEVEISLDDLAEEEDEDEELEKALGELMGEDEPEAKAVDLQPTEEMAAEAAQGLAWRDEFGRGGTEVGVARARDISNRTNLSPETVFRMVSYFARHEVDKQAEGFNAGEEGYPSAGRIAWALWGGDPGQAWAERKARELEGEEEGTEGAKMDGFKLGDFVEYESAGGRVVGKVTDILLEGEHGPDGMKLMASEDEPVVEVEVYEEGTDGMAPSGIMTYRRMAELKMCDEPKMGMPKHLPRFVGKLKKAEIEEDTEKRVGIVKGYLSIFDNVDLGGDVVKMGAFKRTLDHKGGKIVFMADHGYRTDEVLGVLLLEEDEKGLKMEGRVNLKTDQGRNAWETMKFQAEEGVPLGASIGYELRKYAANATGGYDITEAELWEGSVTPFPMNTAALITEATKRYNRAERAKRARLYQALKSV